MKRILPLVAVLALASCETAPPVTAVPDLSFAGMPTISLNVARIELVDNYHAPMQAPNVDHLFRQSPEDIARRMVEAQLVANGSTGTLRVTIEDASVKKRDLPVEKGIQGAFENEPAEEYKAHVALRFELEDGSLGGRGGNASVTSDRTRTLLEDASPADRDMALFKMSEAIRDDIGQGLSGAVKRTFGWK